MASSPTDTLTAIGDGTKLLLDSLARIYGPHIQKRIVVGLKLIDTTKDNRALKTMAIDVDTLRTMMEFVCRNIRRRHLIGLYLVFDRMTKMSVFDMAIMSDLVAQTLAILAIQLHTRRRRPVSRTSSIGGAFDKLHSGWCTHGIATFIGTVTADLLGKMVVKGELS